MEVSIPLKLQLHCQLIVMLFTKLLEVSHLQPHVKDSFQITIYTFWYLFIKTTINITRYIKATLHTRIIINKISKAIYNDRFVTTQIND